MKTPPEGLDLWQRLEGLGGRRGDASRSAVGLTVDLLDD